MALYVVRCTICQQQRDLRLSYAERDNAGEAPVYFCGHCQRETEHTFVLNYVPAVQYATDGFYSYDNSDPHTKYQREHFSRSGDNSEKRLQERRRRRPEVDRVS